MSSQSSSASSCSSRCSPYSSDRIGMVILAPLLPIEHLADRHLQARTAPDPRSRSELLLQAQHPR